MRGASILTSRERHRAFQSIARRYRIEAQATDSSIRGLRINGTENACKRCSAYGSSRFGSRKGRGRSGFGKNMGWQALAKGNAEREAGKMGATHIVFTDYRGTGSFNDEASGKAYICQ